MRQPMRSVAPAATKATAAAGAADSGACWDVVLSCEDLVCLFKLFGPRAAGLLAGACAGLLSASLAELDNHLRARKPTLLQLSELLTHQEQEQEELRQGRAGAQQQRSAFVMPTGEPCGVDDMGTNINAARSTVERLATAVHGQFSAHEMRKVRATLAALARCLGFRRLLGAAVQRAAGHHAPLWAHTLPLLALPASTGDCDNDDDLVGVGHHTSSLPACDAFLLSEVPDWQSAVQLLPDDGCDNRLSCSAARALRDQQGGGGIADVAGRMTTGLPGDSCVPKPRAECTLVYTDMLQVRRCTMRRCAS
jgi:hypothetical protein